MRVSILAAVATALITPTVADFLIYASQMHNNLDPADLDGFGIFKGPPSCDDVRNSVQITARDDVSGNKYGIRCDGCGTPVGIIGEVDVKVLELNDETWGHYTYYKDRNGALVDLDGNQVGTCRTDTTDDYTCSNGLSTFKGLQQMYCTTGLAIP